MSEEAEIEKFLQHFGVKGMKWGVRKAYASRVSTRADQLERVSKGEGSAKDKFVSPLSKKQAAKQAQTLRERADRLENGRATVRDLLAFYGGVNISDVMQARRVRKQGG